MKRYFQFLLCFLLGFPVLVSAESAPKPLDLVVVLDSSRSMQRTDPEKLRTQGTKILYQLLNENDRVGIVSFDKTASSQLVLENVDKSQLDNFSTLVGSIPDDGGFTDLKAGLETALKMLNTHGRPNATPAVLLLSDGKMDPHPDISSPREQTLRVFRELFPAFKVQGIAVHTVALSKEADKDLLSSFSNETGGTHFFASTPEELNKAFTDLFLSVANPQLIALNSESFLIDPSVSEATFLVNRVSEASVLILKDPLGTELTAATAPRSYSWYQSKTFDIVTIKNPIAGPWKVLGVRPESGFASVVTDLRLVIDGPAHTTEVGVEKRVFVSAKMYQGDKVIGGKDLSGVLSFGYRLLDFETGKVVFRGSLNDKGKKGDILEEDLIYSASVPVKKTGHYELVVSASAPTFSRESRTVFKAFDQKLTLSEGENFKLVVDTAELTNSGILQLVARDKDDVEVSLPFERLDDPNIEEYVYTVPLDSLSDGEWNVWAEWKGVDEYDMPERIHSNILKTSRFTAVPVAPEVAPPAESSGMIPIIALVIAIALSGVSIALGLIAKTPLIKSGALRDVELGEKEKMAISQLKQRASGSERRLTDQDFKIFSDVVAGNPAPSGSEGVDEELLSSIEDSEVDEDPAEEKEVQEEVAEPVEEEASEPKVDDEDAQAILDAFDQSAAPQVPEESGAEEEENSAEAETPAGPSDDEVNQMLAALGESVDKMKDE